MLVLIRHSKDKTKDTKYVFDGDLVDKGKDIVKDKRSKIRHHKFNRVYCSPYLRCRRTAQILMPDYNKFGVHVYLSRYGTSDKSTITPKTLGYGIPIGETRKEFNQRVEKFCVKIEKQLKNGEKVAVITHALVFIKICDHFGLKYPPILDWVEIIEHKYT